MTDSAIPDFFQSMISSAVSAVATRRLLTYATMTSVETPSWARSRTFDFSSAVDSPAAGRLGDGGALAAAGAGAAETAGAAAAAGVQPEMDVDVFFSIGHHHAILLSGRFSFPTAARVSSAGGSHENASNSTRYQLESVSWQS